MIPTDTDRQAAGFGVRVVHSGVWGFASSPIVTEDEIWRITRLATEVAKASAIAKRADLNLAPGAGLRGLLPHPGDQRPARLRDRPRQLGAGHRGRGEQGQGA
ncbi:MAG: hypothetical protein R2752_20670 [Vicinamibacterales bacterium]